MMTSFLLDRWRGEAPLETVFWRDMLVLGTGLNIAATGVALGMFAGAYPAWLAFTVNFLPVPYNAFLLVSVWKAGEREGGPAATTANVVGTLWFIVMIAL